jgi:3'-phosphoadenosine 5'-phosphosulfate sulfotransferase (PAPS reductase)/FAD synthetase
MDDLVTKLHGRFANRPLEELLDFFLTEYQNRIALASSLGAEDQVLTDLLLKIKPDARIFILDTGRLHQETYDTLARNRRHYQRGFEWVDHLRMRGFVQRELIHPAPCHAGLLGAATNRLQFLALFERSDGE